jgi:hypothetical protein
MVEFNSSSKLINKLHSNFSKSLVEHNSKRIMLKDWTGSPMLSIKFWQKLKEEFLLKD